jgi:hypothetical protein
MLKRRHVQLQTGCDLLFSVKTASDLPPPHITVPGTAGNPSRAFQPADFRYTNRVIPDPGINNLQFYFCILLDWFIILLSEPYL